MAFAQSRRSQEQEIAALADELSAGQFVNLLALDGGVESPVEVLQRFDLAEGGQLLAFIDEALRAQRLIDKRQKLATFREVKTLEDFDWTFNTSIKRQQIYELASAQFIRQRRDLLFLGPPGLGKSHLAQAIGHQAIKAGFVVLYRSI